MILLKDDNRKAIQKSTIIIWGENVLKYMQLRELIPAAYQLNSHGSTKIGLPY